MEKNFIKVSPDKFKDLKYQVNVKVEPPQNCIECGKPVPSTEACWNIHDYCRLET